MARKGDVEILCSSIFYRGIPSAEILISYAVPQVSWHLDLILPLAARCSFGILPKSFSGFCHDASEASSLVKASLETRTRMPCFNLARYRAHQTP